jgi:alpha-beta hydrolase superfamily lysophospholipase
VPVVAERLRRAGVTDVKVRMFHDARHELLNEINADEVNGVIVQWLAVVRPDNQQRLSDTARTPMQSAR